MGATTLLGCGWKVRAEGFNPRAAATLLHAAQNLAMAGMHAIEIADGQRRRTEVRGDFVEAAKDARRGSHRAVGQTSRSARDVHVPHARTGVDGCLPHALSMGASYLDLEAVISQPDMRRQASLGACVRQIVADVGEENAPRRQLFRGGDGTVYGRMRGVWLVAQSIQKEHIQAAQLCERGIRDLAVIRKISRIAKPESIDRRLAMQERRWA